MPRGMWGVVAFGALAPGFSLPSHAADDATAVDVSVMSFNVWYGGEQVSLEKIGEAIRLANPDIVGVQEADGNLARIAAVAGMPYVDPRRRLLSRWPIFDSGSGERTEQGASPYSTTGLDRDALHAWIMIRPGRVVAVANVHLSNSPSGTGLARRGSGPAEVLAVENQSRVVEATPLAALGRLGAGGTPVFLTGDFNTPSYLDWTDDVARTRDDVPYAFEWPTLKLLADAGLRDSYREAYPDPVQRPGFTWSPGAPHPLRSSERGRDRIDYVLTAGRSRTLGSQIVGEDGGPDVDIVVAPWPSDHRAVVSSFRVEPPAAPPMIDVTPRRVVEGESFLLRTFDPGGDTWSAVVAARGAPADQAILGVREMPHDYQRAIRLSSAGLAPGPYDALLLGENGEVLTRDAFTVAARDARPSLVAAEPAVRSGGRIVARWRNAPGDLRDWVGIYAAGETDATRYLAFAYTEARFDGEAAIPLSADDGPLAPGEYELRLLHDETFVELARARFSIAR
jgi:endonuclease/exonuclease/phosphatase family metal-dependent hydrolase